MSTKYLKAFQSVAPRNDLYELVGDAVLVELIKDSESGKDIKAEDGTIKRLILAESSKQIGTFSSDKPTFVRVLLVGAGTPNPDTNEIEQYDVNPGDICLVGSHSIRSFSSFGKLINYGEAELGLISAEAINLRFKGQEAFERFFDLLNSATQGQVGGNL